MLQSSDNRLQGLTRVEPTDSSFQLPTWTDVPNDHQSATRGELIRKTLSEMQAQMKAIKGEVLATEASRWTTHGQAARASHRDAKDSGEKPQKLKLKPAAPHSQDGQLTVADFPLNNLKSAFEAMTDPNRPEPSQPQQKSSRLLAPACMNQHMKLRTQGVQSLAPLPHNLSNQPA